MSRTQSHELLDLMREVLSRALGVDPADIGPDTRLREDLDADSLTVMELLVELEERYGVVVPDEDVPQLVTVRQVDDYVAARLSPSPNA